jgi:hypothetical protein
MNSATKSKFRRQVEVSERWDTVTTSSQLLSRCKKLLLEAEEFEATASARRGGELDPAVLDCLGATFKTLATVTLLLDRFQAPGAREDGTPDPSRLLFAINQNLRFAAEAAELAGQVLTEDIKRLP